VKAAGSVASTTKEEEESEWEYYTETEPSDTEPNKDKAVEEKVSSEGTDKKETRVQELRQLNSGSVTESSDSGRTELAVQETGANSGILGQLVKTVSKTNIPVQQQKPGAKEDKLQQASLQQSDRKLLQNDPKQQEQQPHKKQIQPQVPATHNQPQNHKALCNVVSVESMKETGVKTSGSLQIMTKQEQVPIFKKKADRKNEQVQSLSNPVVDNKVAIPSILSSSSSNPLYIINRQPEKKPAESLLVKNGVISGKLYVDSSGATVASAVLETRSSIERKSFVDEELVCRAFMESKLVSDNINGDKNKTSISSTTVTDSKIQVNKIPADGKTPTDYTTHDIVTSIATSKTPAIPTESKHLTVNVTPAVGKTSTTGKTHLNCKNEETKTCLPFSKISMSSNTGESTTSTKADETTDSTICMIGKNEENKTLSPGKAYASDYIPRRGKPVDTSENSLSEGNSPPALNKSPLAANIALQTANKDSLSNIKTLSTEKDTDPLLKSLVKPTPQDVLLKNGKNMAAKHMAAPRTKDVDAVVSAPDRKEQDLCSMLGRSQREGIHSEQKPTCHIFLLHMFL
jgi:hypothetical protein